MRITWGALFFVLLVPFIILFFIKSFIWDIIVIAAFAALIIYLYKRFGKGK